MTKANPKYPESLFISCKIPQFPDKLLSDSITIDYNLDIRGIVVNGHVIVAAHSCSLE